MRLVFTATTLETLCMAHRILDKISCEIHFITSTAEIGLFGESPGMISIWPLIPTHWGSSLYSQQPTENSLCIRRSWFEKSVAISLAKRDVIFHLKTRITKINAESLEFTGAGFSGSGKISFNEIFHVSDVKDTKLWFGGITTQKYDYDTGTIVGIRSDSTFEIWGRDELPNHINWIQKMSWNGSNPKNSIEISVREGINRADIFLSEVNID